MSNPESDPEWILSKGRQAKSDDELKAAASRLWPRVQAHVRHKLANKDPDDSMALATEVWETVLQSVSKTLQRRREARSRIADLDAYLFGIFLHRLNRALRRERRRQQTVEAVPSTRELEQVPGAQDWKSARDLERSLELQEAIANMDTWTREVFAARVNGYAWREIAKMYGLNENQAKLRFGRALRKLAARFGHRK
jgi:RNA polymerase sigma factor (sigma-70 family)